MPEKKKVAPNEAEPIVTDAVKKQNEVAPEPAIEVAKETEETKTSIVNRIPKGLDIGMVVYVRFTPGADVQAEKVKAITIRESNVGIMLQSGREVNAAEIGRMVFLDEGDVQQDGAV